MTTHRHTPATTTDHPYQHCPAGSRCRSEQAHGGIILRDVCRCGAVRETASNRGSDCRGPWTLPAAPRAELLARALRSRLAAGLPPGDERELLRAELSGALATGTKVAAALALGCSRPALDDWLRLAGLEVERRWATR